MSRNEKCTVLVASCDKYADVLEHFRTLFKKYWADCPFEVVLVTESPVDIPEWRVVATGKGKTWSAMLAEALRQIDTPYVLLLMDDYYLVAPVSTEKFLARLEQAQRYNALNLRLIPMPRTFSRKPVFEDLHAYKPNTAYCVATQAGIWDRLFLLRLATLTKSAWEFERRGSYLLEGEELARTLLVTPKQEFPFIDAVHKGHWEVFAVKHCSENGITLDYSVRNTPVFSTRILECFKAFIFKVFPIDWIVRVQNLLDLGAKKTD